MVFASLLFLASLVLAQSTAPVNQISSRDVYVYENLNKLLYNPDSITTSKLAPDAITTSAILDGSVTTEKVSGVSGPVVYGSVPLADKLTSLVVSSGPIALPANNGLMAWAHGLSAAPDIFGSYLVNSSADCSYSASDRLILPSFAITGQAGNTVWADATQVGLKWGANIVVANKGSNADCTIDYTKWGAVLWAHK